MNQLTIPTSKVSHDSGVIEVEPIILRRSQPSLAIDLLTTASEQLQCAIIGLWLFLQYPFYYYNPRYFYYSRDCLKRHAYGLCFPLAKYRY